MKRIEFFLYLYSFQLLRNPISPITPEPSRSIAEGFGTGVEAAKFANTD